MSKTTRIHRLASRVGCPVAGGVCMGNILVCDDERSICEMLDIALREEGHKVETVTSGEAAKRKMDCALFDVIVTDIRMPQTQRH